MIKKGPCELKITEFPIFKQFSSTLASNVNLGLILFKIFCRSGIFRCDGLMVLTATQPVMTFSLSQGFSGQIELRYAYLSRVCVTLMYPMEAASSPRRWTWGLRMVTLALLDLLSAETVQLWLTLFQLNT